ncbi:MAG: hypothetical protein M3169_04785 [Candidatus Eremiobacteraeota bacterium]|nr:hypothetical protein [Candidatus Eremiobacteraeota bacterium]
MHTKLLTSRVLLVIAGALLAPSVWLIFTNGDYSPLATKLSLVASLVLVVACAFQWSSRKDD